MNHVLKSALSDHMSACAAHCNRLRALASVVCSTLLTDEQFSATVGQHPDTIARDLLAADDQFAKAKARYEEFCLFEGVPAYAVYSDD